METAASVLQSGKKELETLAKLRKEAHSIIDERFDATVEHLLKDLQNWKKELQSHVEAVDELRNASRLAESECVRALKTAFSNIGDREVLIHSLTEDVFKNVRVPVVIKPPKHFVDVEGSGLRDYIEYDSEPPRCVKISLDQLKEKSSSPPTALVFSHDSSIRRKDVQKHGSPQQIARSRPRQPKLKPSAIASIIRSPRRTIPGSGFRSSGKSRSNIRTPGRSSRRDHNDRKSTSVQKTIRRQIDHLIAENDS